MVRADPSARTTPLSGALVAVVSVAVLLMAIASLQGAPAFRDIVLPQRRPVPTPSTGTQTSGRAPVPQIPDNPVFATIATVIAIVLSVAFLLLMAWLVWRGLRALWARRPIARRPGGAVATGGTGAVGDDMVDADRIRTAAVEAQEAIDSHRDPGDAIIAAWVQLEMASARSGRGRALSETPAEFTLRTLTRRPGLDTELETLLGLYESVRFGGIVADEAQRATARRCLTVIEEGWR